MQVKKTNKISTIPQHKNKLYFISQNIMPIFNIIKHSNSVLIFVFDHKILFLIEPKKLKNVRI